MGCFAAPKDNAVVDFATIPQDRQYPGFIVSGTLPTKNDTDDLYQPNVQAIRVSWGGAKYGDSWVYKFESGKTVSINEAKLDWNDDTSKFNGSIPFYSIP